MIVSINNEKKTVRDGTTLTELLLGEKIISDAGNLSGIAAAVNEKIVSKKDWNHYEIKEGDSEAVIASESELVTMSVKRVHLHGEKDEILTPLRELGVTLLPNTAGARNAKEAVYAAQIARECLGTSLIKLEVHPDQRYLLPDPVETLSATEELVRDGFTVMPYCQADPVLAKRLADAGAACVMPLAAPIGSNRGLLMKEMIRIIIEQSEVPVVVDAGLGRPSDAALAMEMGADAVLVNTAIAVSGNPEKMAAAFRKAVIAGREAYEAGLGESFNYASATSDLSGFLKSLDEEQNR